MEQYKYYILENNLDGTFKPYKNKLYLNSGKAIEAYNQIKKAYPCYFDKSLFEGRFTCDWRIVGLDTKMIVMIC